MELPLTPIDFLLRARRLFPDREGVIEHHAGERADVFTYAHMAERCRPARADAAERLRGPPGRPGRVAVRQPPRAARGLLRRAAGRRACCCRSTSVCRRPELRGQLDDSRARCSSAIRHSPRSTIRCDASLLGDEYEALPRCTTEVVDRSAPDRRARRRGDLLHERLHRDAQGSDADAPRPVPARDPLRAHAEHQRQRRRAAHDPALPRERLGHAALRHRARRRARDAAALRRRARCSGSSRPSESRGCTSCPRC